MILSISNIAWTAENDEQVYSAMKKCGFSGLENAGFNECVNVGGRGGESGISKISRRPEDGRKIFKEGMVLRFLRCSPYGTGEKKNFSDQKEKGTSCSITRRRA